MKTPLPKPDPETRPAPRVAGNRQPPEKLQTHLRLLSVAVEFILRGQPEGLSELELIRTLQAEPWQLIGKVDYSNPAVLYPVHFLLFHTLYRLRETLARQGEILGISPMLITLEQSDALVTDGPPDLPDPLRAFYLDLDQYNLSDEAVQCMLDDFWAGRSPTPADDSELLAAARILGFSRVPDEFHTVKYRFRRAVMEAHPDRGGSTADIQAINHAFATLRTYFRSGGT